MGSGPRGECRRVLSIDVGTTSIKAGVVDCSTLKVLARGEARTPLKMPRHGWAEQDPDELWDAIASAASKAVESTDSRVDAVVTSTYLAGLVLLSEKGELSRILVWMDERAAGLPEELFSGPIKVKGYNVFRLAEMLFIAGGAPGRSGKDPLSKIAWFMREEPGLVEKASAIGTLKTWILFRLARRSVVTPDDAHLTWLVDSRGGRVRWSRRLASRYRVPLDKLPEIVKPVDIVGGLSPGAAEDLGLKPGIPVVAGSGDVAAAAIGSGALGEREYHVYMGTSSWVAVHSSKRLLDIRHYIGSLASAVEGKYLVIAEQETAGAALDWVLGVVGAGYEEAERMASRVPPGSDGVIAAPWFFGERSPIDDPDARAAFIGLTLGHTKWHLVRSVMESVAFNIAWSMGALTRIAGRPRLVRGVGGGFRSRLWAGILASALGTPVEVVEEPWDASLRGAAALAVSALTGLRLETVAKRVKVWYVAEPDPEAAKTYRRLMGVYVKLYERLVPVFHGLRGV